MQFHKKVLPNGLRIIAVPMKDNPTVTVMVSVEAGSEYETKEINGLSHFLEHMCFKGTTRRPSSKIISTEFDSIGAESNAFTSTENTSYYAKSASHHLPKIFDLVSDLYLNPILPEVELEKERGVVLSEIDMYEDQPAHKVEEVLMSLLHADQPAGFTILGPKENIKRLTREDMLEYRKKHYVASGTVISVGGNFNEKELFKLAEKSFANIPTGSKTSKTKTSISQDKSAIKIFTKQTDQTHLRLAFRAYDLYDERFWPLSLLATILGSGMSSRLFHKMREELGLCYYVSARNHPAIDHGEFVFSIGTSKEKAVLAVKTLLEEAYKTTKEMITENELSKAKEYRLGHLFLGLESSDDFAHWYGFQELYHEKILTPDEWAEKIKKVTAEEIQAVAKEIFRPEMINLALVGPFADNSLFRDIIT